jgi:transposase
MCSLALPQQTHVLATVSCSKGIQRDVPPVSALICSSQPNSPHHIAFIKPGFVFNCSCIPAKMLATLVFSNRWIIAFLYKFCCISVKSKVVASHWNHVISIRAVKGKTLKETAENYGTSSLTVIRRFYPISQTEIKAIGELPKVIAIDEYNGDSRAVKYQLIISDGITKERIDTLPNRYKKTVKQYLQKYET